MIDFIIHKQNEKNGSKIDKNNKKNNNKYISFDKDNNIIIPISKSKIIKKKIFNYFVLIICLIPK